MFRFSRLLTVIVAVSAASTNVPAQQRDPAAALKNTIVPPSPEAASLGKFGELPVTLNNGLVSISIPVYEIKTPKRTLPISLQYHAAGVKANDIASCVGLGWSLSGIFSISRVIKGMPDEEGRGILNNPLPSSDAPGDQLKCFYYHQTNPTTSTDGQADEFSYSLPGSSGKFMFNNVQHPAETRKIYTIPLSAAKISAAPASHHLPSLISTDQFILLIALNEAR
jgi:hypothetical protein